MEMILPFIERGLVLIVLTWGRGSVYPFFPRFQPFDLPYEVRTDMHVPWLSARVLLLPPGAETSPLGCHKIIWAPSSQTPFKHRHTHVSYMSLTPRESGQMLQQR